MKFLLDMNLSPAWVPRLQEAGWEAWHWSEVGDAAASDAQIMAWSLANGYCVITNDLDFSAILAATKAKGPSILQVRGQDLSPATLADTLLGVLRSHIGALTNGAIVTLDLRAARVRTLPLS